MYSPTVNHPAAQRRRAAERHQQVAWARDRVDSTNRVPPGLFCLIVVALTVSPHQLTADDRINHITFADKKTKEERTVSGKVLVEAQDGGLLLIGRDGRLWNVTPEQLKKRDVSDDQFKPLNPEELGRQLQTELGGNFEVVTTKHYVICSNAGKRYSQWCGALFERLFKGFQTHWRKLDLHEPEFPLSAIVFANKTEFAKFATSDAGPGVAESQGYFSIATNRMVLFDLTAGPNTRPAKTTADITRRVAASPFNAATVVHEATHQIAFNSGLHTRYADNPLWMTEGMAMYFETPDLRSRSGWTTIGRVNKMRLRQFRQSLSKRRQPDALKSLVSSDDRLRDPEQAVASYAESWALTYFLIKTKRKYYLEYLKRISQKPRLSWDDSETRLREFQTVFGDDLQKLDRAFLKYIGRLR